MGEFIIERRIIPSPSDLAAELGVALSAPAEIRTEVIRDDPDDPDTVTGDRIVVVLPGVDALTTAQQDKLTGFARGELERRRPVLGRPVELK